MTTPYVQTEKGGKGMKAARYYGIKEIKIEHDIPRPVCGEGQVKVQPSFVGICGTDLHEYMGGPNFTPTKPHPVTGEKAPITIGHEFSGTVLEVGKGVTKVKVGDKVAVQPTIYCGSCGACQAGAENSCSNGGFVGLSGGGGGMSEEVVVPEIAALPLPPNVDLDIGALVEPLAPKAVVLGAGPIGLSVVQVLLARGANPVICVEVAKLRQDFAKEFGAHHIIDPTKEDVPKTALELCGGVNGPDLVFDCAGVAASLKAACDTVRPRGTIVNVAIWEKEVLFNPMWILLKEATYKAVLGYQRKDFEGVIDALGKGTLKPARMITSKIRMEELVDAGYMPLIEEKDKHVKILVDVKAGT